ncbi:hypothetical protein H6G51_02200 [Limnothrix sp. FACHB-708]|uniref:hypothetical protein n=1 Tax=unclassified Limnothrix TaxID=2632864 RepID=UPI001688E633|nr:MULTISPECIES: hypothetical protein [unclassified Limnothrix]MBD2552081.1 hypothetical protein [Limnothrix sp. FACHB-708]MBD2589761.1 hypothetical protein [Limnothrix sp. FACHB-406]
MIAPLGPIEAELVILTFPQRPRSNQLADSIARSSPSVGTHSLPLEKLVMACKWTCAVMGSIALLVTTATLAPLPTRAEMPEVVWMVGPAENVEIVTGEIQDLVGDRVRLLLTDGSTRLVGITQLDRTRLGLDPGDQITLALVDGRFFAQAVALGNDALVIRNGSIQLANADSAYVSTSQASVTTTTTVQQRTVQRSGQQTTVQQTTVIPDRPAQPIRGMW